MNIQCPCKHPKENPIGDFLRYIWKYLFIGQAQEAKQTCHTVFENHRKSLIQQCERSELRLHFEWTKVN